MDLDAAWRLAQEFARPAAVIVKHNNPCGTAEQTTLVEAYRQALACDPVSAFGGVMAFNRPLDGETAAEVGKLFAECVVAPGYDSAARAALAGKKNLRLMEIGGAAPAADNGFELKRISGGVLVQEPDVRSLSESELKVVTKRPPTREEIDSLLFAWKVAKHVKSNAIVFAVAGRTLGVGAGQMSRVDSVKIAVMKAQQPLVGSVVGSDAFFPFPGRGRGSGARRGDGGDPAGRLGARRRRHRGGRSFEYGDGLHRRAPFQALAYNLGFLAVATLDSGKRGFAHENSHGGKDRMGKRIAAKITGVAGYLPPRVLNNADMEKLVATTDQWIRERTGITERHVAEKDVATSHLATAAAQATPGTDPYGRGRD